MRFRDGTLQQTRLPGRTMPFKRIIFPFNSCGKHWAVACVDIEDNSIAIYDSMLGYPDAKVLWTGKYKALIAVSLLGLAIMYWSSPLWADDQEVRPLLARIPRLEGYSGGGLVVGWLCKGKRLPLQVTSHCDVFQ